MVEHSPKTLASEPKVTTTTGQHAPSLGVPFKVSDKGGKSHHHHRPTCLFAWGPLKVSDNGARGCGSSFLSPLSFKERSKKKPNV